MENVIVVAGATGNLGRKIVTALLKRGAEVRALVRPSSDADKVTELKAQGVHIIESEMTDADELKPAMEGAVAVVSALQGLRDVIVDTQTVLLDAAVATGVPRFIPSDFASDFTKLKMGDNRNFDLRKEFMEIIDKAPVQATSILNGGFAYLLTFDMPLLNFEKRQVGYWEDTDWHIDFTTVADTAEFTAAAALDPEAPRLLRIASFQHSPTELAQAAEQVSGHPFELVRLGSRADLAAHIKSERAAHPEGEEQLYASWQQSQYIYSMFTVQNDPLDNERYPGLTWTRVEEVLGWRKKA